MKKLKTQKKLIVFNKTLVQNNNATTGITLIALVITIIVLLILAGVTIAMLTGENGIINKANTAKVENEKATIEEKIKVTTMASYDNQGKLDIQQLKDNFIKQGGKIISNNFPVDGFLEKQKFTIKEDGNITIGGYLNNGLILQYEGLNNKGEGHDNNATMWKDLSSNQNDGILSNFDNSNESGWQSNSLKFDGVNDSVKTTKELDFKNSKEMTIEFIDLEGTISINSNVSVLFETSSNSNNNYASFYVDTNEYGINDLCLAMKYHTYGENNVVDFYRVNHKMVDKIFNNKKNTKYTLRFNSNNAYENYISMFRDNIKMNNIKNTHERSNGNVSGESILNYILYIGGRDSKENFTKMNLATIRIYNKELTEEELQYNYEIDKVRFNI